MLSKSGNPKRKFLHDKLNLLLLALLIGVGLLQLIMHILAYSWTGHIFPTSTNGLLFIYKDSIDTEVGVTNFVLIPLILVVIRLFTFKRFNL